MRTYLRNIFAAAEPRGDVDAVRGFVQEASDAHADGVFLVGGLKQPGDRPHVLGEILKALAASRLPSFYIPGPEDAPISDYMQNAAEFEVIYSHLHGVHGTFAFAPGHVIVAGLGGCVEDQAHSVREEISRVSYPGSELEYRLKFLREMRDHPKIFLFSHSPAHKGRSEEGSEAIAEVIKTYNPRLVLVGGRRQDSGKLANSLVVYLGSLAERQFSTVNLVSFAVEHRKIKPSIDAAA